MTDEEYKLLIADLAMRVPYNVIGQVGVDVTLPSYDMNGFPEEKTELINAILLGININGDLQLMGSNALEDDMLYYEQEALPYTADCFKPYLKPLKSINDDIDSEWRDEWLDYLIKIVDAKYHEEVITNLANSHNKSIQWLLKNHYDINGLIEKDLAIAVDEKNNPYINEKTDSKNDSDSGSDA